MRWDNGWHLSKRCHPFFVAINRLLQFIARTTELQRAVISAAADRYLPRLNHYEWTICNGCVINMHVDLLRRCRCFHQQRLYVAGNTNAWNFVCENTNKGITLCYSYLSSLERYLPAHVWRHTVFIVLEKWYFPYFFSKNISAIMQRTLPPPIVSMVVISIGSRFECISKISICSCVSAL